MSIHFILMVSALEYNPLSLEFLQIAPSVGKVI